jgi:PKHD-type hydroxylase
MPAPRPLLLDEARALDQAAAARMAPCVEAPVFSPEECARIIAFRQSLGFDQAPVVVREAPTSSRRSHQVDARVRQTERTHLLAGPTTRWVFDRVAAVVEAVNAQVWRFQIDFVEPLQLLAYPEGGHFDWHSDLGDRGATSHRKVSATVLLAAPESYEGGDLQLLDAGRTLTPARHQGSGIFFPSFVNHRVRPVTRGTRYVLIVWTVGRAPFR